MSTAMISMTCSRDTRRHDVDLRCSGSSIEARLQETGVRASRCIKTEASSDAKKMFALCSYFGAYLLTCAIVFERLGLVFVFCSCVGTVKKCLDRS